MTYNNAYSKVSLARCFSQNGFNMEPGRNYTENEFNMFLLISLAEELGEITGAMKKIIRGYNKREFLKTKAKILKQEEELNEKLPPAERDYDSHAMAEGTVWLRQTTPQQQPLFRFWVKNKISKLGNECADFQIYFDLFLTNNNIDIHERIQAIFNKVSEEMGCPEYILPPLKGLTTLIEPQI